MSDHMGTGLPALNEPARTDRDPGQINRTVGQIIRHLRRRSSLTLDQLAAASGVSRAMLSSVERGEKSPTLSVLAGIAAGLGVTISRLMGEESMPATATVISRRQRLVFRDQTTGIERHLLSPTHVASVVELVEHVLPPGTEFPGGPSDEYQTDKYIIMRSGHLTIEMDSVIYVLSPEDSIYFRINTTYKFLNRGESECRYYIFILHNKNA